MFTGGCQAKGSFSIPSEEKMGIEFESYIKLGDISFYFCL